MRVRMLVLVLIAALLALLLGDSIIDGGPPWSEL